MRKILIIQADLHSGNFLQDVLKPKQGLWSICFVSSAKEALEQLAKAPWDILIADLVSENDKSLLAEVRGNFSQVVRFGLVNQTRPSPQLVSVVHQFLVRPLALEDLEVAVERSCGFRDLLHSESMSRIVGELGTLPSPPATYVKLVEAINRQDASIEEIARIVEDDVAISAKVLQLVNSAIFRTRSEIATVRVATSYLGLNLIKNLVLSSEVMRIFAQTQDFPGFCMEELQAHSRFTARIAGSLSMPSDARDAAVAASLLHDIGKIVLAWKTPDQFERLLAISREQARPLFQIEEELMGVTHAEIGAYLLGLWGLPIPITQAIAYHHRPGRVPHRNMDALSAVYVANLLAHELDGSLKEDHGLWDVALLKDLDVVRKLPVWIAMEQEIRSPRHRTLRILRG